MDLILVLLALAFIPALILVAFLRLVSGNRARAARIALMVGAYCAPTDRPRR